MHYTLFVGDLSIFCTEEDIRELFSTYGELLEVKIIRCEETKKNLSYGFVKYADTEAAVKAIDELNGTMLCGRPMR
jgi:heterogeneous nuclear ribonucleoprotein A1/A3